MNAPHKIERVLLSALDEPERNPNVMEPDQYKLLVEAIKRVGFLQPVLVRPGEFGRYRIVDGVHRSRAAKEAELVEIDCVLVDSDDAEAAALQVGMNRMRGELDLNAVAVQLGALVDAGWSRTELTLTGYTLPEVDDLLKTLVPDEGALDMGAVGSVEDARDEDEDAPGSFVLEIPFTTRKDLSRVRRLLKKAGGGDLTHGLLNWAEEQG